MAAEKPWGLGSPFDLQQRDIKISTHIAVPSRWSLSTLVQSPAFPTELLVAHWFEGFSTVAVRLQALMERHLEQVAVFLRAEKVWLRTLLLAARTSLTSDEQIRVHRILLLWAPRHFGGFLAPAADVANTRTVTDWIRIVEGYLQWYEDQMVTVSSLDTTCSKAASALTAKDFLLQAGRVCSAPSLWADPTPSLIKSEEAILRHTQRHGVQKPDFHWSRSTMWQGGAASYRVIFRAEICGALAFRGQVMAILDRRSPLLLIWTGEPPMTLAGATHLLEIQRIQSGQRKYWNRAKRRAHALEAGEEFPESDAQAAMWDEGCEEEPPAQPSPAKSISQKKQGSSGEAVDDPMGSALKPPDPKKKARKKKKTGGAATPPLVSPSTAASPSPPNQPRPTKGPRPSQGNAPCTRGEDRQASQAQRQQELKNDLRPPAAPNGTSPSSSGKGKQGQRPGSENSRATSGEDLASLSRVERQKHSQQLQAQNRDLAQQSAKTRTARQNGDQKAEEDLKAPLGKAHRGGKRSKRRKGSAKDNTTSS